jgi:hypothetical protein
MIRSGLRKPECLRVLFCVISCALFFAVTSPPAAAQFKAWVVAKLPDTPEGLGVDSFGNLYATLMHIGEVVMLKEDGTYKHIAWVPVALP